MKPGAHIALAAAARFYTPLIALFALTLLIAGNVGAGIGLVAGFAFVLALLMHVLVFGDAAARASAPPFLTRFVLALGLAAAVAGASLPRFLFAPQMLEGGLFAATAAGGVLILTVLVGRAPTMRDEEW
jgi:multisubunit Na+/H+ antiporter MnhB subunit